MRALYIIVLLLIISCVPNGDEDEREYIHGIKIGQTPKGVEENSGMVYSETTGRLYFVNDSGNGNYLFVSDLSGKLIEKVKVSGASNHDWEGLSMGECGESQCLFIGDIGDNSESEKEHTIYVVEERPAFDGKAQLLQKIIYTYADKSTPNAESLAVHPISGDIYIASKNYEGKATRIYRIRHEDYAGRSEVKVLAYEAGEIDYRSLNSSVGIPQTYTAGMSISPDGERFLLITAQSGQAWEFDLNLDNMETFDRNDLEGNFRIMPVDQLGQEESIEYFGNDAFIYSSEGAFAPIVKVLLKRSE